MVLILRTITSMIFAQNQPFYIKRTQIWNYCLDWYLLCKRFWVRMDCGHNGCCLLYED